MVSAWMRLPRLALTCGLVFVTVCLPAQTPPDRTLTPQQTKLLTGAQKDTKSHDFAQALAKMNKLYQQVPGDVPIAEDTAEAAIEAGNMGEAMALLKPLADAGDWRSHTLLARVYQQTHRDDLRDGEIAILRTMQDTTTDPALRDLKEVLIERVGLPFYTELFFYEAIRPWGPTGIYATGSARDAYGKEFYHLVFQSSDYDQPDWQREHPDFAAKGGRVFTIDGFNEARGGGEGAHKIFDFYDERPDLGKVRSRMVEIATHYPHERQSSVAPGGVAH